MQKILALINRNAGRRDNSDLRKLITAHFEGQEIRFIQLEGKDVREKARAELDSFRPHLFIAAGGDGTLNFAVSLLYKTGIPLGIIPAGSANGMAKELGIPLLPEKALQVISDGKARDCDLIRINGKHLCFHLSDVGLNAQLIKYFEEGNVRGKIGYFKALVKSLIHRRELEISVMSKEKELTRQAAMVLIANATKFGTGAVINPEGRINDGYFEVVIVKKIHLFEVLKMFLRFARFNSARIEAVQAQRISIRSRRNMHFQVDGEYLGKLKELKAEIEPAVLRVILPD